MPTSPSGPRSSKAKLDLIGEFAQGSSVDPENVSIEPDIGLLDPQAKERLEVQAYMRAIRHSRRND